MSGDRVVDIDRAAAIAAAARGDGRRVVFTNGCFDLLHAGHVTYLEAARELGNSLIVLVNTDASMSRINPAAT